MVLYNVTINVDDNLHDEWLEWMLNVHIPMVMDSGMFISYKMFRLVSRLPEETGTTYSIQYFLDNMDKYDIYHTVYAPDLQQETIIRFGDMAGITAFRTVLEEV